MVSPCDQMKYREILGSIQAEQVECMFTFTIATFIHSLPRSIDITAIESKVIQR